MTRTFTITQSGVAREFEITPGGYVRTFTVNNGVGPQGPTGATGATGATGSQGPAGPNSVTSATSSDGTCQLHVNNLRLGDRTDNEGHTLSFRFAPVPYDGDFGGDASFLTYPPFAGGYYCVTENVLGQPDKLTNGTISGTLTVNSTTISYGSGSASAHRTALGLGTLATQDANAATFSGTLTINSTSYTYGSGAAEAQVLALGLIPTSRVVKATDETRTNNTVAADSDLVIPLEANSIYRVSLYYHYVTAISGGSITSYADYTGTLAAGVNAGDTASIFYGTASGRWVWATVTPPRLTNFTANSASPSTVAWRFTVMVKTATAGNFRLMWSNGNGAGSGSGSTIVKMGSYIIAEKLL